MKTPQSNEEKTSSEEELEEETEKNNPDFEKKVVIKRKLKDVDQTDFTCEVLKHFFNNDLYLFIYKKNIYVQWNRIKQIISRENTVKYQSIFTKKISDYLKMSNVDQKEFRFKTGKHSNPRGILLELVIEFLFSIINEESTYEKGVKFVTYKVLKFFKENQLFVPTEEKKDLMFKMDEKIESANQKSKKKTKNQIELEDLKGSEKKIKIDRENKFHRKPDVVVPQNQSKMEIERIYWNWDFYDPLKKEKILSALRKIDF